MEDHFQVVKAHLSITETGTLKEAVYEAFRKTIILGYLSAGTRIIETEYADKLNISRTPIRYAMQRLKDEQLIEVIPNKGIIVKGISIKDAEEIYEIRKWLDTLAAVKASERMTAEDLKALETLLRETKYFDQTNQIEQCIEHFKRFNTFIYEKSQMLRLSAIVKELQTYFVYFREIALMSETRRKLAIHEHEMIFRGIKNKNREQIEMITHEHLERSFQFVVKEMEKYFIE